MYVEMAFNKTYIDIVVETFLEIGVSDLLVLTQRLQDQLYMEL
jgi:hypothetical protein